MEDLSFLKEQQVNPELVQGIVEFREKYPVAEEVASRIVKPAIPFYGREILEMAIAGLLKGENILLTGSKATGKNILAETLAYIFHRPTYNVSFHVNTGSAELIGTDTFEDNQVKLRRGSIYQCAQYGGFGILDEINMAKNDAVSVLHATLDYRRSIDVPAEILYCISCTTQRVCLNFFHRNLFKKISSFSSTRRSPAKNLHCAVCNAYGYTCTFVTCLEGEPSTSTQPLARGTTKARDRRDA